MPDQHADTLNYDGTKRFSYNIAHIITLCVKLGFIQALFYLTQILQSQTKSGIFSIICRSDSFYKSLYL